MGNVYQRPSNATELSTAQIRVTRSNAVRIYNFLIKKILIKKEIKLNINSLEIVTMCLMLKVLNLHLKTAHQADEVDDFEQCGKTDVAPEWNWVCN